MAENPILCFNHCDININLLCLQLPKKCPLCSGDIQSTPMKIPPFRLPSPFHHTKDIPYSVVIRPTVGSFLNTYTKNSNLHVGISTSKGAVYNFDERGLSLNLGGWSQCVAITIATNNTPKLTSLWDIQLQEFASYGQWRKEKYDEDKWNCYDFILGFLQLMGLKDRMPCIATKQQFCEVMVLPKTLKAAKYIQLYRKVVKEGVLVQYNTSM